MKKLMRQEHMRQLSEGFFKLKPGSVSILAGAAGSGKSTLLSSFLSDVSKYIDVAGTSRPRRLVFTPGAAKDLPAAQNNKFFDKVQLVPDLEKHLDSVRKDLSSFALNVIVIEDFFLFSSTTFANLVHIFFQDLRHQNVVLILTMQALTNQKNFALLLGYVSKIFLHASASNLGVISRISQRFGYSVSAQEALKSELYSMLQKKSQRGIFDSMLIDTDLQIALCNFQTLSPLRSKKNTSELNPVLELSGMGGDLEYVLVPKNQLERKNLDGNEISDLLTLFPKQNREEASIMLQILQRTGELKNLDRKSLVYTPSDSCSCAFTDLVSVVGGFARYCPPAVTRVIKCLQSKKIGLPQVKNF